MKRWIVSSSSAVVIPPSSGQLICRTKCAVYTRRQSIRRKPLERKLGKMRQLAHGVFRQRAKVEMREESVDPRHDGLAAGEESAPASSEFLKIKAMQAMRGDREDDTKAISQGLVFSVCMVRSPLYSIKM